MGLVLTLVVEIVDGVAVGEDDGVVAPFAAQNVLQQAVAAATRDALVTVVGAHHLAHVAFLDEFFEGGEVGLPKVAHRHAGVVGVPERFRAAMHGVMLGAGVGLVILLVVALHTFDGLHAENARKVRVFAAGLLSPAPSRVAEDVHIRTPKGQFGVAGVVGNAHRHIENVVVGAVPIGTRLIANSREHVVKHLRVKCRRHSYRLRKHRVAALPNTVARLAPPIVGRDAEAVDGD